MTFLLVFLPEALALFSFHASPCRWPVLKTCICDSKWQCLSIQVLIMQSEDPALTSNLSTLCLMAPELPHEIFITSPRAEAGLKHTCKTGVHGSPGAQLQPGMLLLLSHLMQESWDKINCPKASKATVTAAKLRQKLWVQSVLWSSTPLQMKQHDAQEGGSNPTESIFLGSHWAKSLKGRASFHQSHQCLL